jgi:hypothetical protein
VHTDWTNPLYLENFRFVALHLHMIFQLSRLKYSHVKFMLFGDQDEFLYCPLGGPSIITQAEHQKQIVEKFLRTKFDQLMFPMSFYRANNKEVGLGKDYVKFTNEICISEGYQKRNISAMFSCWTGEFMHSRWYVLSSLKLYYKTSMCSYALFNL